jgi:hypothetical protein
MTIMQLTANTFLQQLGEQIASSLGAEYKFYKSRLEVRTAVPGGHNVIILGGSNQSSPRISISFYFGKNFASAKKIEKMCGSHQFYYHIQQYSIGRSYLYGSQYQGPDTWSIDITSPPVNLLTEIVEAIHGMAMPFFQRFNTIEAARDAIAADDPWCFGGPFYWRQLLLLDLAMNDISHFESWAYKLDDYNRQQAYEEIRKFREVTQHAV